MSGRFLLATAFVLALGVVVSVLVVPEAWRGDPSAALPSPAPGSAEVRGQGAASPFQDSQPEQSRVSADYHVRVASVTTGAAIPGARLVRLPGSSKRTTTELLGEWIADADGVLSIPHDVASMDDSGWRISSPGCASLSLRGRLPPKVHLAAGRSVKVRLEWQAGGPAVGVPVIAYQRQAPAAGVGWKEGQLLVPGVDDRSAIFVIETDATGTASFEDLGSSAYGIGIDQGDHVLIELDHVEVPAGSDGLSVAGIVAPAYCCVIRGVGGSVLDVTLDGVEGGALASGGGVGLGRLKRRLEEDFPGCMAVVCCVAHPVAGLTASVSVTLVDWRTVQSSILLLRPSRARVTDINGTVAEAFGALQVEMVTPSGRKAVGIEASAALVGRRERGFRGVPMVSGKPQKVPPGRYVVTAWTPLLQAGPLEVTVLANEDAIARLRCDREIQSLRLRVRCGEETPSFASVFLKGRGWKSQEFGTASPGAALCAGIVGEAELEVRVYGYEPVRQTIMIEPCEGVQDVEVVVRD